MVERTIDPPLEASQQDHDPWEANTEMTGENDPGVDLVPRPNDQYAVLL